MEANLIILLKHVENNSSDMELKDSVKKTFGELYENVSDDEIIVCPRKKSFTIKYKLSSKKSNMLFLKLSCNESASKSAEALSYVIGSFQKGQHRKDWNIVVTYDEASQYYCCKLMDGFGKFERKTRELVYTTLIKMFGVEWYSKSFQTEMENQLKSKNLSPTAMIERALNELTYEQLKNYLFIPYADWDIGEALDDQLSRANVEKMDRDALVDALNKCRVEKSLWDRFFSQYKEFDDFKAKIDELQNPRNSVMHHKEISKEKFDKYKKKLRSINAKLDRAIEILEDEIYSETKISDILGAISKVTKHTMSEMFSGVNSALAEFSRLAVSAALSQSNISQMVASIADQFQPSQLLGSLTQNAMNTVLGSSDLLSQSIQNSMPDLSYLNGIQKQLSSMPDFSYLHGIQKMLSNPAVESAMRSAEIANRMAYPFISSPESCVNESEHEEQKSDGDQDSNDHKPEDDEKDDEK
ncbi:MAG: hypothetical protein ACI4HI_02100 [Lachnospiraceae bacterium]